MKRLVPKQRWLRLWLISACALAPVLVMAKTSLQARYPYDPACPWGRLSNGKGMIHRCLSEEEATKIAVAPGAPALARRSDVAPTSKVAADDSTGKATATNEQVPPVAPTPDALTLDVQVTVGPIEASEGEITVGRLSLPVDRYKACVTEGGGLTDKQGNVTVKFLVRAEAERAEGASVESYKGISEKAAKCVASVVDRRQVGSPSAAMTAAKLHFTFTR